MSTIKEPVNTITHLIGAILSLIALGLMLFKSITNGSSIEIISSIIFGLSLIALYTASTIYHWIKCSKKTNLLLKKLDHSMIYVLIAGSYTPISLLAIKGKLGFYVLLAIWTLAILGIITKLFWINAPRWIYTSFYLGLGWLAVFFIMPIVETVHMTGFLLLLGGGLSYSIGAVIYAIKSDKFKFSVFGFHEIFHLFILFGSFLHYMLVSQFLLV
ncbi:PAQR family membrane homeostasis protein TrhA [Helicovermis profundi]|uniref:Hemolysin III family protein n=1 Tax=Helicovermis profundi TaxID=3065157 RepID=A0AAU9DZX6_9FIRM|nr:hemolysin III family protein [Clostridia bacterium S502]